MAFCAICTADIPATARARYFEGSRACDACLDDVIDPTTPERRQRGYRGGAGGTVGVKFRTAVAQATKRIVPERIFKLEEDRVMSVPPAKGPSEYDPSWRDQGMSREQVAYQQRAQSRNRSKRKDSV